MLLSAHQQGVAGAAAPRQASKLARRPTSVLVSASGE